MLQIWFAACLVTVAYCVIRSRWRISWGHFIRLCCLDFHLGLFLTLEQYGKQLIHFRPAGCILLQSSALFGLSLDLTENLISSTACIYFCLTGTVPWRYLGLYCIQSGFAILVSCSPSSDRWYILNNQAVHGRFLDCGDHTNRGVIKDMTANQIWFNLIFSKKNGGVLKLLRKIC